MKLVVAVASCSFTNAAICSQIFVQTLRASLLAAYVNPAQAARSGVAYSGAFQIEQQAHGRLAHDMIPFLPPWLQAAVTANNLLHPSGADMRRNSKTLAAI